MQKLAYIEKKTLTLLQIQTTLKTTIMYHLTQTQAMILVVVLLIVFLVRSTGKAVNKMCNDDLGRKYPEFKEALSIGYPLLLCQEMKKRDMVYRDWRWVPRYCKNDVHDPELRKKMKEKDLILNDDNKWVFTGKTKEYLQKNHSW